MSVLTEEQVRTGFSRIVADYNLSVVPVSDREVALLHPQYIILISLDHDGLSYVYYDRVSSRGYNLALFLINKRRGKLKFEAHDKSDRPMDEYIEFNTSVFERHLLDGARDILSGEKGWIADYVWPPVSMPPVIATLSVP